jgi:hypothetical protein
MLSGWQLIRAFIAFAPLSAFADRYGLCEGAGCGGGFINGIFGLGLLVAFLAFLGARRAAIFLAVWFAPGAVLTLIGEKTGAFVWFLLGFYFSIALTPKIYDWLFPN